MKKILTAALAALTLGGAAIATATPADARPYGGHWGGGYYHGGGWRGGYRGGYAGPALVAGLAGLAVGAALTGPHYGYGYGYGPGPGYYYGDGYAPYGACYATHRVWDPYYGRWILQRSEYPC